MIETEIVTTTTYESVGAVTGLPDTLDKGQSAVITAELTTTNPYGDINFSIFNPLINGKSRTLVCLHVVQMSCFATSYKVECKPSTL